MVLACADSAAGEETARKALGELCKTYWRPIFAFICRRGYSVPDAQDLTQDFLLMVLEGDLLKRANPARGRFRSLLLKALQNSLTDDTIRKRARKRGGGALVPLEFSSGEERYQREPAHDETPERIFQRRWALAVLDRVVERLRNEFVRHGRPEHFQRLKVFLLGQTDAPYAALAREMNTSEGALKVAIHRLRKRYRELFRQEIADTVADPAEVESELRFLAAVLTGK